MPEFAPWQGAGLLVWWDMANYVRFERAQLTVQGQSLDYASFEVRQNGQVLEYANATAHPVEGKSTYLKLERHGDKLTGSFSADGADWTPLLPADLKWPQALRVGVSASQDTTTPLNVQFEDYKLTTPAAAPAVSPATATPAATPTAAAEEKPRIFKKGPIDVQVGSTTIATLPADTVMEVDASKSASAGKDYARWTGVAKVTVNVARKPALVIRSEELTLRSHQ